MSNDSKHNIISLEACQNKDIKSNRTCSMETSSSSIFEAPSICSVSVYLFWAVLVGISLLIIYDTSDVNLPSPSS